MKGDFTRDTFDVNKHFARVLMQQGRVQLDADWNEQVSVLLHYMQTLAADLIGQYGGPATNTGFRISRHQSLTDDFFIGAGHYYVDGILCELDPEVLSVISASNDYLNYTVPSLHLDNLQLAANDWIEVAGKTENNEIRWYPTQISAIDADESTLTIKDAVTQNPVQLRRLMTYKKQPDYPDADIDQNNGPYLAYLDVWERHITQLDDNSIREVALGGPDTTTRSKIMCQVRVMYGEQCDDVKNLLPLSNARMRARLSPEDPSSDPCIIPPISKFRGAENQLYRVEIHEGSTNARGESQPWTFKWSRDNASVEAVCFGRNEDGGLVVNTTRGFAVGEWVEITREVNELRNEPGELIKITRVDDGAIYLESIPGGDSNTTLKIRRWDQKEVGDVVLLNGAVKGYPDRWLDLEDGIQVYFEPNRYYRTGDYWLIPARVAGWIEWPYELDANGGVRTYADGSPKPSALEPHGIKHHYAPLALLTWDGTALSIGDDCRCSFNVTLNCPPPNP
jgi:hypothetical protein